MDYGLCRASPRGSPQVCNNRFKKGGRETILTRINASNALPGTANYFPSPPREYICGALRSVVSLSPAGTAPDGYRHLEFLLAGTVVVLPKHPCIERLYANLPVVFVDMSPAAANSTAPVLTCDGLMAKVRQFAAMSGRFEHERLTLEFWRARIRRASILP